MQHWYGPDLKWTSCLWLAGWSFSDQFLSQQWQWCLYFILNTSIINNNPPSPNYSLYIQFCSSMNVLRYLWPSWTIHSHLSKYKHCQFSSSKKKKKERNCTKQLIYIQRPCQYQLIMSLKQFPFAEDMEEKM